MPMVQGDYSLMETDDTDGVEVGTPRSQEERLENSDRVFLRMIVSSERLCIASHALGA